MSQQPPPSRDLLIPRPDEHARAPKLVAFNRCLATVALIFGILLMAQGLVVTFWLYSILGNLADRTEAPDPGLQPEPVLTGCPWNETCVPE